MNAKDAILYLYDKGLLNIDAIMKNKDSIMQELDNATENKPKHDPCRLFKEGDKVRYCERDGRKIFRLQDGAIYEVKIDEGDAGTVEIWLWKEVGRYGSYPYNVFELVTPVEEQNPYSVHEESTHNRWNVIKDKYVHGIHAMFPYKNIGNSDLMSREEAKARADKYSDRLNAEYRNMATAQVEEEVDEYDEELNDDQKW